MMSHGTFLELMNIAAHERGLRAEITLFPEGVYPPNKIDERPVARVKLIAGAAARKDPLFAQILKRRTNRNAYDLARPIPAAAWQSMADAVKPYPFTLGHVDAGAPEALQRHRAIAAEAWRIELVTPRTILESYKLAARRRIRNRAASRRVVADGPDRRVAQPLRPVRSEQGASAERFRHNQPDHRVQPQARLHTSLPLGDHRKQRPRDPSRCRPRLHARPACGHSSWRGDASVAAGPAGVRQAGQAACRGSTAARG